MACFSELASVIVYLIEPLSEPFLEAIDFGIVGASDVFTPTDFEFGTKGTEASSMSAKGM
jgi:hypothetical protein